MRPRRLAYCAVLVLGVLLVLSSGCLNALRLSSPSEEELRPIAQNFLREFERIYELENRFELKQILYEDFGGQRWGANRLIDRMNEVFNQYESIELRIGNVEVRRSSDGLSGGLIVTFNWELSWTCVELKPSTGCKDFTGDGSPDRITREGYTVFSLVKRGERWVLKHEESDLLLGAYEPGYRTSP